MFDWRLQKSTHTLQSVQAVLSSLLAVGGTSPINMASTSPINMASTARRADEESSDEETTPSCVPMLPANGTVIATTPVAYTSGVMTSAESNPGAADGAGISAEFNTEPPKPHPPPADGIPTATDKVPPFDIESDIPPQMYGEPWQYLVDNYGAPIDCELNPNPGAADGAAISAESNPGAADGAGISAESNTEPPKFRYVTCGTDGCGRSEHWQRFSRCAQRPRPSNILKWENAPDVCCCYSRSHVAAAYMTANKGKRADSQWNPQQSASFLWRWTDQDS